MTISKWLLSALWMSLSAPAFAQPAEPPREWIDPTTGHRIIRLSDEPGSRTLYFHDPPYTPQGDKMIFAAPGGLAVMDITKLGIEPPKSRIITQGGGAIMARRSREVYVSRGVGRGGRGGGPVYAVNVDAGKERLIPNAVSTVISCDESFGMIVLRGDAAIDPSGKTPSPPTRPYVPRLQRMFPGKKLEDQTS